jgi:hypothetical protein
MGSVHGVAQALATAEPPPVHLTVSHHAARLTSNLAIDYRLLDSAGR